MSPGTSTPGISPLVNREYLNCGLMDTFMFGISVMFLLQRFTHIIPLGVRFTPLWDRWWETLCLWNSSEPMHMFPNPCSLEMCVCCSQASKASLQPLLDILAPIMERGHRKENKAPDCLFSSAILEGQAWNPSVSHRATPFSIPSPISSYAW